MEFFCDCEAHVLPLFCQLTLCVFSIHLSRLLGLAATQSCWSNAWRFTPYHLGAGLGLFRQKPVSAKLVV